MPEYFSFEYLEKQMNEPITGIIHIGAHYGEEAPHYQARSFPVIWFEGHPEYYQKLAANIAQYPGQLCFQALLSDTDHEEVDFWITADEFASSMLKPAYHQVQNPHAYTTGSIRLKTIRFDTAMDTLYESQYNRQLRDNTYNLLILDVQGSELKVWNGMGKYQTDFNTIISEYSTVEFYEGVPRLDDLDRAYEGFIRVYPDEPLVHGDALYVRQK